MIATLVAYPAVYLDLMIAILVVYRVVLVLSTAVYSELMVAMFDMYRVVLILPNRYLMVVVVVKNKVHR
jgi:hypothetical protein